MCWLQLDRELDRPGPGEKGADSATSAALLLVEKRARKLAGACSGGAPTLHMSFTGNPGTGKTTVALRMAEILHRLGYMCAKATSSVTRDDLVGQYIGHTAPKTKEVLKKAMGGVLFIDEAYYLYRPENERDYGQEAIEILLQVMENQRDDLVVILAGYADRMDTISSLQPRLPLAHRPPHRLPDYADDELFAHCANDADHHALPAGHDAAKPALADYITRAPRVAAFRQCALHPQRARPGAAAAGQSPVRRFKRSARRKSLVDDLGRDIRASRVFSMPGNKAAGLGEGDK
jgi:probable Rubsico expression protein CbbX